MIGSPRRVCVLLPAIFLGLASVVPGATIVSQPGPDSSSVGLAGSLRNGYVVGWSQTQTYSSVAIAARLFYGGSFQGSTSGDFTAFLSRSIGVGSTALAFQKISVPASATTPSTYTLFTGLTLGPGRYYLTIAAASADSNPAWATSSGTMTLASGVTYLGQGVKVGVDLSAPYLTIATGGSTPLQFGVTGDLILNPTPPPGIAANGVVNGASFLTGIAPGSWVTIQGTNLASTNPGRVWSDAEIQNGKLPTALDGVSVTIDNKPAYVYYISPTQINVQAPSDAAQGTVSVVVTNNGSVSAPAGAQLQPFAPAFFQYSGAAYAIATRHPDNALIANPNAVPGAVGAKAGDVLILWGTGFGATNPATPAGVAVTTAATAQTAPTVTVGGIPATMIGTALSPGSAGLYQVAIQLPASVPSGDVEILASVGGFQSPPGVIIYVSK